jgi:hypothetical protein
MPRKNRTCEIGDCANCASCAQRDPNVRPIQQLFDLVALFPNITELIVEWQVSNKGVSRLDPTPDHAGNQLRYLRCFNMVLSSDPLFGSTYGSQQAAEARMIVAHLPMPSLEVIGIDFMCQKKDLGYVEDFEAIRDAVCGIKSSKFQRAFVYANLPLWEGPFPDVWVSTRVPFLSRVLLTSLLKYAIVFQSAIKNLTVAVVERSDIASFSFNITYDLQHEQTFVYNDFFIQTSEGPRLLPSVVPDKPAFTQLVQQTINARTDGRSGCTIKVNFAGEIDEVFYSLLETKYKPLINSTPSVPSLSQRLHSVGLEHAGLPLMDETRIEFRLDRDSHNKIKAKLTHSGDENSEDMLEDSDMAEDDM